MVSNDNLIVSADNNFKINDLFKVSPKNIVGDNPVPVSSQYEEFNFNKMNFTGSGEFTGIYYEAQGNNLGCKGVYVIGVYSTITETNSILNKEVTLYLSDKQLSELQSGTSLLKQCDNASTTFDNSYYTDKSGLIAHLKTVFNTVTDTILNSRILQILTIRIVYNLYHSMKPIVVQHLNGLMVHCIFLTIYLQMIQVI